MSSTLYALCIETSRNFVNQNKGKITLKIFPWGRVSLAMSWHYTSLFQLKTVANKKIKIPWELKSINFVMVNAIPWEILIPLTKCEGLSCPTHFLKSRGSVIRNNFLEYRTKQATLFAPRNDFNALFATNKAKDILNRLFSCSCSDTIYSQLKYKEKLKSTIFEGLPFLY